MGNKIAVTDNGVHKIGKKLFLTDENRIHRKARKAFLTKDGVHRLVFSSFTVWQKYNAVQTSHYEGADDSFSKGSTYYGEIEVEDGVLPEEGFLEDGSAYDSYCVLYVDGNYYYYVRGD